MRVPIIRVKPDSPYVIGVKELIGVYLGAAARPGLRENRQNQNELADTYRQYKPTNIILYKIYFLLP